MPRRAAMPGQCGIVMPTTAGDASRASEQSAAAVLMIRPRHFASNAETLASNRFQRRMPAGSSDIATAAQAEFDALAAALAHAGVEVHVFDGQADRFVPDEVFPNNWISLHADGSVVLYPMQAANRRLERRSDIVETLQQQLGYQVRRVVDLSGLEQHAQFLEGTGSLVLDRPQRIAYACLSPRTHREALKRFGEHLGFEVLPFEAVDTDGHAIYHTNVLMSVGTRFAVVCSAAVHETAQRAWLIERLGRDGRVIVDITFAQMNAFAGNLLELRGRDGTVIVLSRSALGALDERQRRQLAAQGELVTADVGTIETYGGGSVRCMLTEVHLPRD